MGAVNEPGGKVTKQADDWVNKNLTQTTAEICAKTLFNAIQLIFSAPFDIAMGLIEIIQNKKYSRYIVATWSVIGASVLLASLVLYVVNGSYPFNAWGLGVSIASLVVLWIAKHPVRVKVSSTLAEEIMSEIARVDTLPSVSSEVVAPDAVLGQLYADDIDDDDTLDDDDDDLLDEDDTLLDDDDDCEHDATVMTGIDEDTAEDLYSGLLGDIPSPSDMESIDPELSRDLLEFLTNNNM